MPLREENGEKESRYYEPPEPPRIFLGSAYGQFRMSGGTVGMSASCRFMKHVAVDERAHPATGGTFTTFHMVGCLLYSTTYPTL